MDHEALGQLPTPDHLPAQEEEGIKAGRFMNVATRIVRTFVPRPSTKAEREASNITTLMYLGLDQEEIDRLNSQN